jgi:hypothetical protein
MIGLISIENDLPVIDPEVRTIPVFRRIIERDRGKEAGKFEGHYEKGDVDGRKKYFALKELAFIFWYADPRSRYKNSYSDEKLRKDIVKKILELPESWEIDKLLQEAIDFYVEDLKHDFDTRYLEANISTANKTIAYLEAVDYNARDVKGNLLYKPQDVVKVQKEAGAVIDSLKSMREKVINNLNLNRKIRGQRKPGRYEDV